MNTLGILISGRGSNFQAIAASVNDGLLDAAIAVVISNKPDAPGLHIAEERGIPSVCIPSKGKEREVFDREVAAELQRREVGLVCLAGFMRLLSPWFVREFDRRILNIHPSLLPAFPGVEAAHQALDHGVKITGCTVHFVDEHLDAGSIIRQAAVPVMDDDTEAALSARILVQEHRIYTEAIRVVLSGRYRVEGRRVLYDEAIATASSAS